VDNSNSFLRFHKPNTKKGRKKQGSTCWIKYGFFIKACG